MKLITEEELAELTRLRANEKELISKFAALGRDHAEALAILDTVLLNDVLVNALIRWWESYRPVGWTREDHVRNPWVNLNGNAAKDLAAMVARLAAGLPPTDKPKSLSLDVEARQEHG